MWAKRPLEHPNDERLLAFLDGELSRSDTRAVEVHLKRCWKCRATLADLESQVKDISRLLSAHSNADADRSSQARKRFLERKSASEEQQRRSDDSRSHPLGLRSVFMSA
jgi:anti-sigma factor RsiW